MKSPKTVAIAFLALTSVSGALLAWHQYQELIDLRAAAMNADERADLQRKIWELQKANRNLADQLAATRGGGDATSMLAAEDDPNANPRGVRGDRGPGGPRGGRGFNSPQQQAIRDLLNKPEVQAMIEQQQKLQIAQRYAALFKNLNLAPAQATKLEALLAERQNTLQDVMAVARDQGIDPRTDRAGFQKLMTDAQNEVEGGIKSLLGDSGYSQLENYDQTIPQRNVVNTLQQRLSYSDNPLTSAQAEQLVQILATNAPAKTAGVTGNADPSAGGGAGRGPGGDFGGGRGQGGGDLGALAGAFFDGGGGGMGGPIDSGGRGGASAPITAAAVTQAQSVLSQPQVAVLQQLQQQQAATQQLRQLVNDTMNAAQPPPLPTPRKGG